MTNPSRPASNGRLAEAGSSFLVDIDLMMSNGANVSGARRAPTPPASAARHTPSRTARTASPIATAPAAHEFEFDWVGPCNPKWMATLQHDDAPKTFSA